MNSTRRTVLAAMGAIWPATAAAGDAGRRSRAARKKRARTIDGLSLAYVEAGDGDPIVFLHGNPTSSHLWRNVIPYAAPYGRCIAPDLLGMGDSDKVPDAVESDYRVQRHIAHLDAFMERVRADRNVTLVVHDWGGPLGFDWARRNETKLRALVFMETFVWRMPTTAPKEVLGFFQFYRSQAGAKAVLDENQFVETVLLRQMKDRLSDQDFDEYRRPFATPGASRLPTLAFPRQAPIGEDPADVAALFDHYLAFMARTKVPKLWINVQPGALIPEPLKSTPRSWPNLTEVEVEGTHFVQEDVPHAIGRSIRDFLKAPPE